MWVNPPAKRRTSTVASSPAARTRRPDPGTVTSTDGVAPFALIGWGRSSTQAPSGASVAVGYGARLRGGAEGGLRIRRLEVGAVELHELSVGNHAGRLGGGGQLVERVGRRPVVGRGVQVGVGPHRDERAARKLGGVEAGPEPLAAQLDGGEVGAGGLRLGAQVAPRVAERARVREHGRGRDHQGDRGDSPRHPYAARQLGRQEEGEQAGDVQVAARVGVLERRPPEAGEREEGDQDGEQREHPRRHSPVPEQQQPQQDQGGHAERPAPVERVHAVREARAGQSHERAEGAGRAVDREVDRLVDVAEHDPGRPVGQPPDRVRHDRDRHDPQVAPAPLPRQLDDQADRDRDAQPRACQRHGEEAARCELAAAVAAVERQKRPNAGRQRDQPRDLERPDDVLPARAEEQQERGGAQRKQAAHAPLRIDEHERREAEMGGRHQHPPGCVVVEPGCREQQLVDRDGDQREVLVVRLQERVEVVSAALEHPRPLVEPERGPARLVEEERRRHGEQRAERDPGQGRRRCARPRAPATERRVGRHDA